MGVPRFILAADHRTQFEDHARAHHVDPARIREFKRLVVRAAIAARDREPRLRADGGLLLDRVYGAEALDDARRAGIACGEPIEMAGAWPLAWTDEGVQAVAARRPAFAKVLIRVPLKDPDELRKHDSKMVGEALDSLGNIPLIVELVGSGHRALNQVTEAVFWIDHWLSRPGPTHWKVCGDPDARQLGRLVESAPHGSRFLVLGAGADLDVLEQWFAAARTVPEFVGFAVGRTIFWPAFEGWLAGKLDDEGAVTQITDRYLHVLARWS